MSRSRRPNRRDRIAARGVILVTTTLLATACGGDAPGSPGSATAAGVERRDSAGVEIVETRTPLWSAGGGAWTLEPEPELSIGVLDGEEPYVFGEVAGAVRLDDGTVVVADDQVLEVRYFDASGRHLRTVGGPGEGPGELSRIRHFWSCGADRIHVVDTPAGSGRVHVWNARGELQRTSSFQDPAPSSGFAGTPTPYRSACSPEGDFIAAGWGDPSYPTPRRAQLFEQHAGVWLLDSIGRPTVDLGEHLVSERVDLYDQETGRGSVGPHPFARELSLGLGSEWVYLGRGEALEVSLYDRTGRLARVFRGPPAGDLEITEELLAIYSDDPAERVFAAVDRLGIPQPPALPAYTELHVSPDGHVWVKRFQAPGEEGARWGVFAPDGAFLGHVETPPRFTVHQVGDDRVTGVATDELGVERVEVYRVRIS